MNTLQFSPSSYFNCTLSGEQAPCVKAREIHQFLGVGKDFNAWMRTQISRCGLREKVDFIITSEFTTSKEENSRGRPTIEYYVTVRAAKHIAMSSSTAKGALVRDYFVHAEQWYASQRQPASPLPMLTTMPAPQPFWSEEDKADTRPFQARADEIDAMEREMLALEIRIARAMNAYEDDWNRLVGNAPAPKDMKPRTQVAVRPQGTSAH